MGLLPTRRSDQRLLLAAVIPLALVFAYHNLVATPRSAESEALRAELDALTRSNAAAKAIANQGGEHLEKTLEALERQMGVLEALVPRTEEVPLLLREISLHARDRSLELTRLKPEAEEPGEHYVRRTYEIAVQGPYHGIGRFLTNLGTLSRIMTPVEFKLLPVVGRETNTGLPMLSANFRLLTYVIPTPGELADTPDSVAVAQR